MRVLVTGATGFLGKRLCNKLKEKNVEFVGTSQSMGLDLRDKKATQRFFERERPEYVLHCAAYVGGISFGYEHQAEIFTNNMEMTISILEAAHNTGVKRIVNPIANCAYPAKATIFREEEFWDGPLHESVMVYGFVRKAFWMGSYAYICQYNMDIVNLIFSNMYGPEDHFDESRSHALGALIMKIVKAKEFNEPYINVWGSGTPVREWLHVDDAAEAMHRALFIKPHMEPINIGIAAGISILDMVKLIKEYVGYNGIIKLDPSKPDGALYKTVDGAKGRSLFLWMPEIEFENGVRDTIDWYIKNKSNK